MQCACQKAHSFTTASKAAHIGSGCELEGTTTTLGPRCCSDTPHAQQKRIMHAHRIANILVVVVNQKNDTATARPSARAVEAPGLCWMSGRAMSVWRAGGRDEIEMS